MNFVADILLAAGAIGAGLYCYVLSGRLRRFTDLEKGVGGAVAVLSAQVDDLTRTIAKAQAQAREQGKALVQQTERADAAGKRLELLLASLHDLPEAEQPQKPRNPFFVRHPEESKRTP
ncbi:hypothetical protein [Roseisalinus antarcticus]|uniref:Uncharacterized protein n=1 Tax=Roseisalinus antarcticus TaxID=254357 RepID=A0A1Y5TYH5_9RHOB|nr:hypothetical protein [Roseisalinus antarcticus]SLN76558.1 hypothetical protein ROA7023_04207 [Roseisalinus antarcticus]